VPCALDARPEDREIAGVRAGQRVGRHRGGGGRPDGRDGRRVQNRLWLTGGRIEQDHHALMRVFADGRIAAEDAEEFEAQNRIRLGQVARHHAEHARDAGRSFDGPQRLEAGTPREGGERVTHDRDAGVDGQQVGHGVVIEHENLHAHSLARAVTPAQPGAAARVDLATRTPTATTPPSNINATSTRLRPPGRRTARRAAAG
jgi:hypothetical protein